MNAFPSSGLTFFALEIPNKKCQRQLILIAKVLQNMANLATMSHKETFMKDLEGFMTKNQPKFVDLYQNLLVRYNYDII